MLLFIRYAFQNYMKNNTRIFRLLGGSLGFLGVSLGAFGAHKLKDLLIEADRFDTWETATFYLLIHSVALLVLGFAQISGSEIRLLRWAGWFWFAGCVIFSGSLYVLCLSGISKLGAITPLGGLCFLAGWVLVASTGLRKSS